MMFYRPTLKPHIILTLLLIMVGSAALTFAQSPAADTIPFRIEIGQPPVAPAGTAVLVPVTKTAGSEEMSGFDLQIGYDSGPLTLISVQPGIVFSETGSYQWEYFTYRYVDNSNCGPDCPASLVRIVGVADINNGSHHPLQYLIPDGTTLFHFSFYISQSDPYDCQFTPLRFYWTDCSDNGIAYGNILDGTILGLSNNVYDFNGTLISDPLAELPTYYGAPDVCVGGKLPDPPVRFVDFVNGGIDISCDPVFEYIGDLNFNGIQYEIADAILFINYFLYGLGVFTINVEGQIAASDVNLDGLALSIADLVYLLRIINGEGIPVHQDTKMGIESSGTLYLDYTGTSINVKAEFEEDAGGIQLVFYAPDLAMTGDYSIIGAPVVEHMQISSGFDNDSLKILVAPPIPTTDSSYIPSGMQDILEIVYNGEAPVFANAQASTRLGEVVDLTIEESYGPGLDPFGITISSYGGAATDTMISIPVTKSAGSHIMDGFDFFISFDKSGLELTNIVPGEIFTIPGIYEWEYFSYRDDSLQLSDSSEYYGVARIVGVADIVDGAHQPLIKDIPNGTNLFYLNFHVKNNPSLDCTTLPLRFLWNDCGDNGIAFPDSGTEVLAVSASVMDFSIDISDPYAEFPTLYGTPENCINPEAPSPPIRMIDFTNGYINVNCEAITDAGDINLNGIPNEIADMVVFENYLFYGLSSFTINVDAQIAAAEIKGDGTPLTFEDFIYLQQTIFGVVTPAPLNPPMTFTSFNGIIGITNESDSTLLVRTAFDKPAGGLYLKFYAPGINSVADIGISLNATNMWAGHDLINDTLTVIIHGDFPDFPSGQITPQIDSRLTDLMQIQYTGGTPVLVHAEAAGFYAEHIDLYVAELPNNPPVFDEYPPLLVNDCQGGFNYTFVAQDSSDPPDPIRFSIVSGPGEINSETGEWTYYPLCLDTGTTMTLEVCASDLANPCPQQDPASHAVIQLQINAAPPAVGDVDGSSTVNLLDATYLISYLYKGGAAPAPLISVGDADGNGFINLLDITYIVNYLYKSGPEPYCP